MAILFLSALSFVILSTHLISYSPFLSCYISTPYLYALSHPPPLFSTSYFSAFCSKFDSDFNLLFVDVLVTGVDPLRVYVHREGLTRLSTSDYSLKNIDNKFAHLTNYSINKKSDDFRAASVDGGEECETEGHKWSLGAFRRWLACKESPEVEYYYY